jgi:hypothetical protein
VESKIPPDDLDESQLAGLALIASCLPAAQKQVKEVCVALVYLCNEHAAFQPDREGIRRRFRRYCQQLARITT